MSKKMEREERITRLLDHYSKGSQQMDTRRTRKNGWNDIISAYMSILPTNWPFLAVTTDPRIRTAILDKTSRLLNSKLQGRLVPREGGDITKAKINNAILDFQWDFADEGGSMMEKIALADQVSRLFGAAFVYVYWNSKKNANDIKVCDPRDIFIDFAATHKKNAKWVQYREFTTLKKLEERGFDVKRLRKELNLSDQTTSQDRSNVYESIVKQNRNLEDLSGKDLSNPTLEVVTEFTPTTTSVFLPKYAELIDEGKNKYAHGEIPFVMLRYYPLGDDVYGESEVEPVIPLQRAINSTLCAFLEQSMLTMRPPLKISSVGVRTETIEYGPGAHWIMQDPNQVQEMQFSQQFIANFNSTYPALVAAFNTAMGSESLGISNTKGAFTDKTATEVNRMAAMTNTRDQYNQQYLAEFLKDIMLMWLSNNKQYLFDDPTKQHFVLKIVGKDNIQAFQAMKLEDTDIPQEALDTIEGAIMENPDAVSEEMIGQIINDVSIPVNPVITNPDEQDPEMFDIKKKLSVADNGEEADLYITPQDLEGVYDYIPDVKSMSVGAGEAMQQARQEAVELALNPQVSNMLAQQGEVLKIKELLVSRLDDAGYRDSESLFKPIEQGGAGASQPGAIPNGIDVNQGMGGLPQAIPNQSFPGGVPQPQGF